VVLIVNFSALQKALKMSRSDLKLKLWIGAPTGVLVTKPLSEGGGGGAVKKGKGAYWKKDFKSY